MHFDDRLATVLRLPANGKAIARIQFRQLVDLLGSNAAGASAERQQVEGSAMRDAALARLEELAAILPAAERAAILREPATRLRDPDLVAHFATSEPEVASAAMAAASLAEADWLDLIPALPIRARGILRHRRGMSAAVEALLDRLGIADRALPPVADAEGEAAPPPGLYVIEGDAPPRPTEGSAGSGAGIGAIVRRIEAFRRAREPLGAAPRGIDGEDEDRLDLSQTAILAIDFATDDGGRIIWADGPAAPALVGLSLAHAEAATDGTLATAIRLRQPISEATVRLDAGAGLAGDWRLDAVPQFAGAGRHFAGYAGRLRRLPGSTAATAADSDVDRMRQILHELRTPANAIQVAAEIIQQQLYGPAPHEYRALAATIAGDTAQILAGFEELDRLVKLESGLLVPASGRCDLDAVIVETIGRLRAWTAPRGSGFSLPEPMPRLAVPFAPEEVVKLVWRLLAALAGTSEPGEILPIRVEPAPDLAVIRLGLPAVLARLEEGARLPAMASDATRSLFAGVFGVRFSLHLATAEARAAGGALEREGETLRLSLPGHTLGGRSLAG